MKKLAIILVLLFLTAPAFAVAKSPASAAAKNSSPAEMFKKTFPDRSYESITPTQIAGVYEVYTGNQIFYYAPAANVLLYGHIVTKEGVSLTRESHLKKMAAKMAQLPLASALKIGTGKTAVVEFLDPDCFHCRESYKFFSHRKDVTVYLFFYPLSVHSEKKIRHILCSSNQLKTYEEVMTGKFDGSAQLNICTGSKVEDTIKTHKRLAAQIGIQSTPVIYIKSRAIDGFEAPSLEKMLKE